LFANPQLLAKIGISPQDAVISTAVSAAVGSFICGVYGNLPFSIATGLGLTAYVTYGLVLSDGMPIAKAFTCMFVAGVLFLIFSLTGLADRCISLIPNSVKLGTIVGMGLLVALIGMNTTKLVVANEHTIIGLGDLTTNDARLTLFGLVLGGTLLHWNVHGSIFISICIVTVLKWLIDGGFPEHISSMPHLESRVPFDFIDFRTLGADCIAPIIAVLFVVMFDVCGVTYGMASLAGLKGEDHSIQGSKGSFVGCSVASCLAATMGNSCNIVYVETAAGIRDGGRSGLTGVVVSMYFVLSLLFAPLFSAIPPAATSPVLVMVGAMMMSQTKYIDWEDMTQAIPAYLTIAMMPFTYSINNGIVFGICLSFAFYVTTGRAFEDAAFYFDKYVRGNNVERKSYEEASPQEKMHLLH
jgi:AGZA family xanthine/uracil permease-like MFS transporter